MSPEPESNPELPHSSPELMLIAALTQASVATMSKKRRALFLAEVTTILDMYVAAYAVVRIRPVTEDRAVLRNTAQAQAWWRQVLGVLSRTGRM